jgi:phenylalanyl-tRNA synthetase alpha chain
MNDLEQLVQAAREDFAAAATPAELENAKARFLGKAGRVTDLLKGMAALSHDEKKTRGAEINQTKQDRKSVV